ncbi:MAG: hypothetical protein JNL54_13455 [Kineosporiaceae bacterium]|nr:hypothetical protein [Kineosporiaceae bacterium]
MNLTDDLRLTGDLRLTDDLRLPAVAALLAAVGAAAFGPAWFPLALAAPAVLFAVTGAQVAAALDRARPTVWGAVGAHLRRVLVAVWITAAGALATVMAEGERPLDPALGAPLDPAAIWWVLPLAEPPVSPSSMPWAAGAWFARTTLVLMVLSPALLWLYRRWPRRTLAAVPGLFLLEALGVVGFGGPDGQALRSVATYGGCWVLGFAHHDGWGRVLSARWVRPLALALAVGMAWWLDASGLVGPTPATTAPAPARMVFGLAVTLLVLRAPWPQVSWVPPLSMQAIAGYLWHVVAVDAVRRVLERWVDPGSTTGRAAAVVAIAAVIVLVSAVAGRPSAGRLTPIRASGSARPWHLTRPRWGRTALRTAGSGANHPPTTV